MTYADPLSEPAPVNSSFSKHLPTLQIYVDSSSLNEFKICPRRYYYSIVMGRQPQAESVHLTFGILMHRAIEDYHKARAVGTLHEDALRSVVHWVMKATWDRTHNRPWASGDKYKNRNTLIRTIVWYLDKHAEDVLQTVILQGGKPAVELPFEMDSGYTAFTGEQFILCGKLDRIVTYKSNYFVADIKTTQNTIGDYFFKKFNPDNQMSMYSLAGLLAFNIPVEGVIIDGCQVATDFSRFERAFIERSDFQLHEWQQNLGYWLINLNQCAERNVWPMNDSACTMYGGCPFRAVCAQANPTAAMRVLEGSYRSRTWDPLRNRFTF